MSAEVVDLAEVRRERGRAQPPAVDVAQAAIALARLTRAELAEVEALVRAILARPDRR